MGSGFESQGAHFKENPADSSESAGFLRSLNKYSFVVRGVYILFAPAGDPSSQSSDTLMSRQRIYAPLRVSVFGVRFGPVGVAVDVRWFSTCAPCLANWGGEGCRLLVCCLVVGCFACRSEDVHRTSSQQCGRLKAYESPPLSHNSSGQSFQKSLCYRTGQIRVTNSRKSSTSLPCSNKPTPKRVATSALSSNDK